MSDVSSTRPSATVGEGSAAGKVILLGEHAVVYGAPGIAAGIERGANAIAEPAQGPSSLLLGGKTVTVEDEGDLAEALRSLLSVAELPPSCRVGVKIEARTELAPGGGLGCSAALGVAIGRAVEALGEAPRERALERANAWERVFHGNPSGIDTAAAYSGTFMRFTKADGARPIASPVDLHFAVGHSGTTSSTKAMVEGIARIRARKPEQIEKFLGAIESLVQNAELALGAADVQALGRLLDLNQMLLAGLMLSTENIEQMCRLARESGAVGAKLTGSGGGGAVIALAASPEVGGDRDVADRIVRAWQDAGFTAFATKVRGSMSPNDGVRA